MSWLCMQNNYHNDSTKKYAVNSDENILLLTHPRKP